MSSGVCICRGSSSPARLSRAGARRPGRRPVEYFGFPGPALGRWIGSAPEGADEAEEEPVSDWIDTLGIGALFGREESEHDEASEAVGSGGSDGNGYGPEGEADAGEPGATAARGGIADPGAGGGAAGAAPAQGAPAGGAQQVAASASA